MSTAAALLEAVVGACAAVRHGRCTSNRGPTGPARSELSRAEGIPDAQPGNRT